jgi:integrase
LGLIGKLGHISMSHKLKDSVVKALPLPISGNKVYFDAEVKGFGVRVTTAGHRSFVLDYRFHGRQRRYTIGEFPTWSTAAARDEAQRLKRLVDTGTDPQGLKDVHNNAPTFDDLWKEYEVRHLPLVSAHSQRDQKSMFNKYIIPYFGKRRLIELKYKDIQDFHSHVTHTSGPTRANRITEVVRKAYNLAIKLEWIDKNPAQGFHKNPEQPRELFLTHKQIEALSEVLDQAKDKPSANIIKLLMLTGARKGEVLKAEWSEFDLEKGTWTKPSAHTKQKREHRIPLSNAAINLLKGMQAKATTSHLFPSKTGDTPQTDLKHFWENARKKAKLSDKVRLHDLRHTFASILASEGESLHLIGKLLGHTQPNTTMRYAKLFDEPLKEAANKVGKKVSGE